jgi:hypothetical protein
MYNSSRADELKQQIEQLASNSELKHIANHVEDSST